MDRFKDAVRKAIDVPIWVILLTDVIAVPYVIFALTSLPAENPASFGAYFLSSYALIVTCVNFRRVYRRARELVTGDELALVRGIKALMRKNRYTRLYLESRDFRAEVGLYTGLVVNMLYAVFKCVSGSLYRSAWLWSIGIYYFFLGLIRFMLMRGVRRGHSGSGKLHEFRTYRLCGAMMMALDLAVGGMAVQMIWQNKANEFSQATVIISAAYTFYYFILSVYNAVSFRKRDNAVLSAAKYLALTGAFMSMFSLQTSMIHVFGGDEDEKYRMTMNSVTGGIVIAIVLGIATYMIIHGTNRIRALEEAYAQEAPEGAKGGE